MKSKATASKPDADWGAHAPSRVVFGALAEDSFRATLPSGCRIFPAGAPETAREGACSPRRLRDDSASSRRNIQYSANKLDLESMPSKFNSHGQLLTGRGLMRLIVPLKPIAA